MAVIIGSATSVVLEFPGGIMVNTGLTSIDWSFSTNIQRLYTLGQGVSSCGPNTYANIKDSEVSVSFSILGGNTPSVDVCAADACEDAPSVIVTISPAVCGGVAAEGITARAVYINSYSYSKGRTEFGTESWAGSAYVQADPDLGGSVPTYTNMEPTKVILGLAEGTIEAEDSDFATLQEITGAYFRDLNEVESAGKGSVQAGATSLGEYSISHTGVFQSIGGSKFKEDGVLARANVSMSLTPVYYAE